jgi:hypothetical protein
VAWEKDTIGMKLQSAQIGFGLLWALESWKDKLPQELQERLAVERKNSSIGLSS